jgi:hypothetical protein
VAYSLVHFWPGATNEQYRAMNAVIPSGLAEGQIYHAAGQTDNGFLVVTVWDSKESCDRFIDEVLMANMPVEGGFEGRPDEHRAEVVDLHTA